jgi:hypothetical protein
LARLTSNKMKGLFDKNKERGFTLIIASFVLTVGIVGAYMAISGPIHYTKDSMSKITAAYLAQEGVEIVRNIRDTNWLQTPGNWNNGLMSCSSGCEAEYNNSSLIPLPGNPRNLTKKDFYSYDPAGTETIFSREIVITNCPLDTCLQITSTVYWGGKSITIAENLYNWYEP